MQANKITNSQETQQFLKENNVDFKIYEHEAAPTVDVLREVAKLDKAPLAKNLFYTDKKSFYFLYAKHDTQVEKSFWKGLNLKAGNMRFAKEEDMTQILQVQRGSVNPLALINDSESKVAKFIIDENLMQHEHWSCHPMENNQTLEFGREDFLGLLKKFGKTATVFNISQVVETKQEPKQQKKEAQKKPQEGETLLKVTAKKEEDISDWYQQVILKSEMLDYYDISGCYILRPWAFSLWERIQAFLDNLIKLDDVENCYFPIFVTQKALETEKDHVEGFSPEVAWVTKSGQSDLQEPIAIRPTSETIMYPAYSKWIRGHRDLPLKLNQWTNVVRWEFKHPTPFIRTREFLWQEGHTAHATKEEADEQTYTALEFYRATYEELLAVPVIKGIKTEMEKFPGGDYTTTVETIIPENGRSVQCATSHQLGQNFANMFNIQFEDEQNKKQKVWQTSWGFTTRSIGVMILTHGDDIGLVLPPRVANIQVVIVPILIKDEELFKKQVEKAKEIAKLLKNAGIRVKVDDRDNYNPGWKFNHWEVKGVPLRLELGPKDYKQGEFRAVHRNTKDKFQIKWENIEKTIQENLDTIQNQMLEKAKQRLTDNCKTARTWEEFLAHLNDKKAVLTPWCEIEQCEEVVKKRSGDESKQLSESEQQLTGAAKSLCMPLQQDELKEGDVCFQCGKQAKKWVYWGRSY
ncbi:YbaK/aminoacyl-tRNA synthetase-associated domain [Pseudocohnilembus persalinus]|uniref:proline--tRNA ligase n=1 Tax=Pseudocohnilembus persalinus TaxID=266149 RepID=A0A0V0QMU5_PSEPJ|nr:YbaK/aminoacyl-tRNA synthetase-associated domain [Pseudocohnilembus persalinus]|eukprot:KRX03296.1 YbaK/aminoacyl-tRNA synthetase-associated domain [Pseudocohnilembus persalinus]